MPLRLGLVPRQMFNLEWGPDWPARVLLAGIPILTAVGALLQRHGRTPLVPAAAAVALAIAPLVVGALDVEIPWPAAIAAADIGTLLVLRHAQEFDLAPFILVATLAAVGMALPWRAGLVCVTSAIAVPVSLEVAGRFTGSFTWAIAFTAGWSAGFGVQELLTLLQQLQDAQRDLTARAAADERRRIAAELHDVIAHTLSVAMLHITGARLALETGDRDEAIEALAEAERTGRASLADVRQSVGLLADGGAGTAPALPDAAAIPALVDTYRSAGLDVVFRVAGPISEVPPAIGLALYRVAQESLTNVTRHAPGTGADLELCVRQRRIELDVRNPVGEKQTPDAGGGRGVNGMRERVCSLGGAFEAGTSGRDWVVHAEFAR